MSSNKSNFDKILHKELLKNNNRLCDIITTRIKLNNILLFIHIIFIFSFSLIAIISFINGRFYYGLVYIFIILIWCVIIHLNKKTQKINKKTLKQYEELYEMELKIVDYKKYLSEQRLKKLKKINGKNL